MLWKVYNLYEACTRHICRIHPQSHIVAMYAIFDLQTIYIMYNVHVYNLALRRVSHCHKIDR